MLDIIGIIFAPLTMLNPLVAIMLFSAIFSMIVNLCYKFMIDPQKAKEIKTRVKEIQEEMKQKQKENDIAGLNALMSEAMKNNSRQMKLMIRPMMVSMLLAILILPWLNQNYAGFSVTLPFSLPLIGNMLPFGWISWYILSSIPFVLLTRKLLGIEI